MNPSSVSPAMRNRARQLRRDMTPPERALWKHLKSLKPQGMHFRRQAPIGPYVADFAWMQRKLIVELDGPSHDGEAASAADTTRQAFLEREGFKVLRFSNSDALRQPEVVIQTIFKELQP